MNDVADALTAAPGSQPMPEPNHLPDPIRDALQREAQRREAARNAEAVRDQLAKDVDGLGQVADGLRGEVLEAQSHLRDLEERLQQANDRRLQQHAAMLTKQAEQEGHVSAAAMYRRMAEREAADLGLPLPLSGGTGPQQMPPPGPVTADQVRQHAGLQVQEQRAALPDSDVTTTRADTPVPGGEHAPELAEGGFHPGDPAGDRDA